MTQLQDQLKCLAV